MTKKILAGLGMLGLVVAYYVANGNVPNQNDPRLAAWDVNGGAIVTTCFTADVEVPCDTAPFSGTGVCPTSLEEIVRVRFRGPVDDANLPATLSATASRAVGLVDSIKETPGNCPGNGKVLEVVGTADDGATCVLGDVTGGGQTRRVGRCCNATDCACAGPVCVQCPKVEVAGHEGVCDRRICRAVRAAGSPPAQAVSFCDARGL